MGLWQQLISGFGFGTVFKIVLYFVDVGTDAYNTFGLYADCHHKIFAVSLLLLFLPNIVISIASFIEQMESKLTLTLIQSAIRNFVTNFVFLHPLTIHQLWTVTDHHPSLKAYEVVFEAFPQFILQSYTIFLFGVGISEEGNTLGMPNNILSPVVKILGVVTSFISIVHGINCKIVDANLPSRYNQRNILKCCFYTLPDILTRILLFSITWVLLGEYSILVHIALSAAWGIIFKICDQNISLFQVFISCLKIQVCPQEVSFFRFPSFISWLENPGMIWIWAKTVSNTLFLLTAICLNVTLNIDAKNVFIDTARINSVYPANATVNICNETNSYQNFTYVDSQTLNVLLFPIIYISILLSSTEIFSYCFFPRKWREFTIGPSDEEELLLSGVKLPTLCQSKRHTNDPGTSQKDEERQKRPDWISTQEIIETQIGA